MCIKLHNEIYLISENYNSALKILISWSQKVLTEAPKISSTTWNQLQLYTLINAEALFVANNICECPRNFTEQIFFYLWALHKASPTIESISFSIEIFAYRFHKYLQIIQFG